MARKRHALPPLLNIAGQQGFICPRCGDDSACYGITRTVYQCSACRHQVSVTAGTLFHSTNLPLVKWLWALCLVVADKGGIAAVRISKHIGVSWPTARNMLKKIRTAMAHLDSIYRLFNELVEIDDAYVSGKKPEKRGRSATWEKPIVVAVENRGKTAGFVAMKAVEAVSGETIKSVLAHHRNHGQRDQYRCPSSYEHR